MVKLAFQFYKNEISNQNLIILHGLFGSSKNWVSVANFAKQFLNVYSLDLRNHGDSGHSNTHSLDEMATDVWEFIQENQLTNLYLLGHSMGGLVAMQFALKYPEIIKKLIIIDIAPRNYDFGYEKELQVLEQDLSKFSSRVEIHQFLSKILPDPFILQFLEMNIIRDNNSYRWKINVPAIKHSKNIFISNFLIKRTPFNSVYTQVDFIIGEKSEYFLSKDREICLSFFPKAKFHEIKSGGHYIHFTHFTEFTTLLENILN